MTRLRSTLALSVVLAAVALVAPAAPSARAAAPEPSVRRIEGSDRYSTAVAVARATWLAYGEVTIARGDIFPDALVASYVSAAFNGINPILLVGVNYTPPSVIEELQFRRPVYGGTSLHAIGDQEAVTLGVEADLLAAAGNDTGPIYRLAGADRYVTSVRAATMTYEPVSRIFIASGENFADALSVAPLSAAGGAPVLLTRRDQLPAAVADVLFANEVYVLGGEAVISKAVMDQITSLCEQRGCRGRVTRIAGADRYETATKIADLAVERFGFGTAHVNLVTGLDFPDAVVTGPHGALERAVTLFVRSPDDLGPATRNWLITHRATITSIDIIGDRTVVSDVAVADARAAAA